MRCVGVYANHVLFALRKSEAIFFSLDYGGILRDFPEGRFTLDSSEKIEEKTYVF